MGPLCKPEKTQLSLDRVVWGGQRVTPRHQQQMLTDRQRREEDIFIEYSRNVTPEPHCVRHQRQPIHTHVSG